MKIIFSLVLTTSILQCLGSQLKVEVDEALRLLDTDPIECYNLTIDLLEKSKTSSDDFALVKTNFILGYLEKKKGDYGKSIIYYLEAIRYAQDAEYDNLTKDLIYLFQNTGNIFKKFGNYGLAREYYSKSMAIASEAGDFQKYTYLVLLSAKVLKEEGKHQEALSLLQSTFSDFEHIQKKTIADIYNQLGLIHTEIFNKELALENFRKLIEYTQSEQSLVSKYSGRAYHNVGNLYYQVGELEESILHYKKALRLKKAYEMPDESLFTTLRDLGEVYMKAGQFDSAEHYLEQAEFYYQNSKNIPKYYEVYKFRALIRKKLGDLKGYAFYQDTYSETLELHHEEQRQIEAADKKYNLDLITQRYFALVAEQERNNQIQYYSAVGGSFLVSLIVLIIAFFQYRKYALRRDLEASLRPYIKDAL